MSNSTYRHFKLSEFASPDDPGSGEKMDRHFIVMLDGIREECGFPFIVTSGYRTEGQNKRVGGVPESAHCRGKAADILTTTAFEKFMILRAAIRMGVSRIGIGTSFVHLDIDHTKPRPAIWIYPSGQNAGMA